MWDGRYTFVFAACLVGCGNTGGGDDKEPYGTLGANGGITLQQTPGSLTVDSEFEGKKTFDSETATTWAQADGTNSGHAVVATVLAGLSPGISQARDCIVGKGIGLYVSAEAGLMDFEPVGGSEVIGLTDSWRTDPVLTSFDGVVYLGYLDGPADPDCDTNGVGSRSIEMWSFTPGAEAAADRALDEDESASIPRHVVVEEGTDDLDRPTITASRDFVVIAYTAIDGVPERIRVATYERREDGFGDQLNSFLVDGPISVSVALFDPEDENAPTQLFLTRATGSSVELEKYEWDDSSTAWSGPEVGTRNLGRLAITSRPTSIRSAFDGANRPFISGNGPPAIALGAFENEPDPVVYVATSTVVEDPNVNNLWINPQVALVRIPPGQVENPGAWGVSITASSEEEGILSYVHPTLAYNGDANYLDLLLFQVRGTSFSQETELVPWLQRLSNGPLGEAQSLGIVALTGSGDTPTGTGHAFRYKNFPERGANSADTVWPGDYMGIATIGGQNFGQASLVAWPEVTFGEEDFAADLRVGVVEPMPGPGALITNSDVAPDQVWEADCDCSALGFGITQLSGCVEAGIEDPLEISTRICGRRACGAASCTDPEARCTVPATPRVVARIPTSCDEREFPKAGPPPASLSDLIALNSGSSFATLTVDDESDTSDVTGAVYLNIEGGVPQAGAGIELARVYLGIGGLDLEGGFFGSATVRRIGLEPIKRAYGVFVDDQTFVIPERGLDFALTVRIRKKGPLGTNESTIFRRARLTNVNPVVGFVDSFTGAFQLNLSVGEGSEHLDLVFNGTLGGELVDSDDDGIIDAVDNCPFVSNPDQSDEPPEFVDVPDLVYTKCTLDEPTSLVLPTVSDACTPENVSLEAVITSVNGEPLAPVLFVENNIGALPTGTLEIEWTAIDANGNATMTTQAVEVIAEPVLFANGELKIGDGVSVLDQQARGATLVNTGTTETNLGVSALSGDVLSAPTLVLRNNALVEGFAKTGATIEPQDGADVLGAKLEHAEFSLPEFFDPAPSFPPSGLDYDLQPGEEIPLAPGSYGRISVKSGAVLSLASDSVSGRYFFDELVAIEPGATVVLDQSEGPIDIYVSNKLFYRGVFVDTNDDYSTFTIGYYGTETAFFEQSFNGVITAPNAKLVLGGADGHTGRFFGQDIEVYPHQGITYAPYGCTPSVSMVAASCGDGLLNGMETDLDCGGPDCAGCPEGAVCSGSSDCLGGNCTGGVCQSGSSPSCSEETALDIGGPGNDMTVPNDSCLMVRDAYPSWWGVRNLQLQTTSGGDYPAPFTWSNPCVNGGSGASGSAALSFDWQSIVFGPTSSECATIISLNGDGTGEVTVRYWAN